MSGSFPGTPRIHSESVGDGGETVIEALCVLFALCFFVVNILKAQKFISLPRVDSRPHTRSQGLFFGCY